MAARAFQLTASLAIVGIPLSLIQGVNAFPGEPDFFCYARNPYNQVVNLNSLCRQTPPLTAKNPSKPATTPTKPDAKKAASTKGAVEVRTEAARGMEFSELNYDDNILVGFIRNRTGKQIGRATINYATYTRESDTKWTLIYSGSARTEARQLQAGEKSSWEHVTFVMSRNA